MPEADCGFRINIKPLYFYFGGVVCLAASAGFCGAGVVIDANAHNAAERVYGMEESGEKSSYAQEIEAQAHNQRRFQRGFGALGVSTLLFAGGAMISQRRKGT